jgi:RimJ/RimL family protein N-acetyltransferase
MLVEADESIFAALIRGEAPPPFRLVSDSWEKPEVLRMLHELAIGVRAQFTPAAWLIVEAGEIVGLCSVMRVSATNSEIEIGYGIAPARQGRGAARRAIADVLTWARSDARVAVVRADTSVHNIASQRVLERNGFARTGTRTDAEDGDMICWAIATK